VDADETGVTFRKADYSPAMSLSMPNEMELGVE
jgi:hypothetical protein